LSARLLRLNRYLENLKKTRCSYAGIKELKTVMIAMDDLEQKYFKKKQRHTVKVLSY